MMAKALVAVVYPGALALLWWLPLPVWSRWGVSVAVVAGLVRAWRRQVSRRGPGAVTAVDARVRGRWRVRDGDGRWTAVVLESAVVQSHWIVLGVRPIGGRRRYLWLPRDGVGAEAFRRLRALLKWRRWRG